MVPAILAGLIGLSGPAQAESMQIGVLGMSCGRNCPPRVEHALLGVDGVLRVQVNYDQSQACIDLEKPVHADILAAALAAQKYTLGATQQVESCPKQPVIHPRDPWARTDGVDAITISDGFTFELDDHQVEGKFTIFDFGASWCGPCHIAADRLRAIMPDTPDLAVRAISLGHDPDTSFDYPVVQQHMAFATGLPWFIVVSPSGKKIYEGNDLDRALRVIEKKRQQ